MAAIDPKSNVKVVFGAMTIGKPGIEQTRVFTLDDTSALLDVFQAHGHNEIDTAHSYGGGTSEEYLGDVGWAKRGLVMDTKLYPTYLRPAFSTDQPLYSHKPEDLRAGLEASLKRLKTDSIDLWYLHGPDRQTPWIDTLREVNELYKEGKFRRFGISNFQSWEVAQLCDICEQHSWIKPSVYQGLYNAWHRKVEEELVPCLRHYGISLYVFNPLAGGFLTGRYSREQTEHEQGERFDPNRMQGQLHRNRYWNDLYFDALEILTPVAKKHQIPVANCALRWLAHHSVLKKSLGDGVIVGASSTNHLEENLAALDDGPLPEEVVQALDQGWERIRGKDLKYWH